VASVLVSPVSWVCVYTDWAEDPDKDASRMKATSVKYFRAPRRRCATHVVGEPRHLGRALSPLILLVELRCALVSRRWCRHPAQKKARARTSKRIDAANGVRRTMPTGKHAIVVDEAGGSDGACNDGGRAVTIWADGAARSFSATAWTVVSSLLSVWVLARRHMRANSMTRIRSSDRYRIIRGKDRLSHPSGDALILLQYSHGEGGQTLRSPGQACFVEEGEIDAHPHSKIIVTRRAAAKGSG
jgi:hypothetical protein